MIETVNTIPVMRLTTFPNVNQAKQQNTCADKINKISAYAISTNKVKCISGYT